MVTLMLCLTALLLGYLTYPGLYPGQAQAVESPIIAARSESPTPSPAATPLPTPTATRSAADSPTPEADPSPDGSSLPDLPDVSLPVHTPAPDADYTRAVPKSEEADAETWFKDAVFIGDSRTDGFHLYSGVKGGSYLVHTGLTVFDVVNRTAVLGSGEEKYSVLSALSNRQYGKVYISLGINELGWFDAARYAEAMGKLVDAVRDCQPNATVYIQAIIPVCPEVCKAHKQPYYVTNDNIAGYNDALAEMCAEKEVWFVNVSEALVDPETWELPADLTHDGVHFKREGYQTWLSYLLSHTGEGEPIEEEPEETPAPEESPLSSPEEADSTPPVTQTPQDTPVSAPSPSPTAQPGLPPAAPEATPADTEKQS